MITLDVALDKLLHKRAYRDAFLADDHAALDLSADDVRALSTIDRRQLSLASERIAKETFACKHRGTGDLRDLFPLTIAAWLAAQEGAAEGAAQRQRAERELAYAFLGSEAFDAYREHPFAGVGQTIEEAFFVFCEAAGIGDPAVRERELLSALVRALAVTPTMETTLPPTIRRVAQGFFAVTQRGAVPVLFAAVAGRYVTGELTPFLAELLLSSDGGDVVAARHDVVPEVFRAAEEMLRSLGLR